MASSSAMKALFFLAVVLLLSHALLTPVLCRQLSENRQSEKEASKSSTQTEVLEADKPTKFTSTETSGKKWGDSKYGGGGASGGGGYGNGNGYGYGSGNRNGNSYGNGNGYGNGYGRGNGNGNGYGNGYGNGNNNGYGNGNRNYGGGGHGH
jgi:hypothetical protein